MRWPSHASHYTNRIYELLLTWSTSSFIAKLVKERERIFLHLMHGEMTPRFLVALFTNQVGCTCMAACSRWEVQLPFSHPWQTPTQELKGKWPYVTAHLSKLWNAAFSTSSHKLLSLSLQQHDLMWRKKGGEKKPTTPFYLVIQLNQHLQKHDVLLLVVGMGSLTALLGPCMCHVKLRC